MALKGDRNELYVTIGYFGNSVMSRGGIACAVGFGSGGAMDQSQAYVSYPAASSGAVPVGLLLDDMVSIDLTRQHINWYRDEIIIGGKVACGKRGEWVTNMLIQGSAPIAVGDLAVLTSSGNIMNVPLANVYTVNKALNPPVGKFMSTADEDGYARISVEL